MAEKTREQIEAKYKWNLNDIYESEEKWEADFKTLSQSIDALASLKETMTASASALASALEKMDEADLKLERLYVYARMHRDENNADAKYQALSDRAEGLSVKLSSALSFVDPLLLSLDDGVLERYMKEEPRLKPYGFMLRELIRAKQHILSEKEERLLSLSGDFAGGAKNTFTMLNNADLTFGAVEHNGKTLPLTHGTYITLMEGEDRELRKKVYEQYYAPFKRHINTITSTYASSVKKDIFYARARGYESALQKALFSDNVPISVYDGLIETIHENLPVMYKYVDLRSRVLGIDELHMYDIYTPLVGNVKREYPYEKAVEMVKQALSVLGDDYVSTLSEGFDNGWVDVFETAGKTSGAYSWGAYGTHPYVLLNHRGNLDSVFTIAHEMGHAMHTYYSNESQPHPLAGYVIFVAEVASTVNEILLTKYLLRTTEDKELKKYVLNHYIDQFRTTVVRQTMFAEFEKIAHHMAENDEPLTTESLNRVYGDLNALYYGEKVARDDTICCEWARIPHFYNAFYVYKYATGFSSAVAIVKNIEESADGLRKYRDFLRSGGSDHPILLLEKAGVDMGRAANDCMEEFNRALAEFMAL